MKSGRKSIRRIKRVQLYLAIAPVITEDSLITVPNKKVCASYFPRRGKGWAHARHVRDAAYYDSPLNYYQNITFLLHRVGSVGKSFLYLHM